MVKNLPAGDAEDLGSILESERSPWGRNGNPFQYCCLKRPRNRGAWHATVRSVANTQIKLSMCAPMLITLYGSCIGLFMFSAFHLVFLAFILSLGYWLIFYWILTTVHEKFLRCCLPSILGYSAFFIVQLSHPYMPTGKTITWTRWTFVSKVMSLLFNMLFRLVMAFLPRSKCLLISWLHSPSPVILEPQNKVCHCFHCFPIYLKRWDRMSWS